MSTPELGAGLPWSQRYRVDRRVNGRFCVIDRTLAPTEPDVHPYLRTFTFESLRADYEVMVVADCNDLAAAAAAFHLLNGDAP
jgi:hypothetical protein